MPRKIRSQPTLLANTRVTLEFDRRAHRLDFTRNYSLLRIVVAKAARSTRSHTDDDYGKLRKKSYLTYMEIHTRQRKKKGEKKKMGKKKKKGS